MATPTYSMTLLEARTNERGDLELSVKHIIAGNPVEHRVTVPQADYDVIRQNANPAQALTTWLQEKYAAPPTWATGMVGQTISL